MTPAPNFLHLQEVCKLSLARRVNPVASVPRCPRPLPFVRDNRWVNLWPPQDFAESFTPVSDEAVSADRGGIVESESDASSATGDISSFVFMGNFVLFMAVLAAIFLIHVALASGVEAYWLAKVWLAVLLRVTSAKTMLFVSKGSGLLPTQTWVVIHSNRGA